MCTNTAEMVPHPLPFLTRRDPTVPPPPDLSDGTPVYLYAVICSSDHCYQPHANARIRPASSHYVLPTANVVGLAISRRKNVAFPQISRQI